MIWDAVDFVCRETALHIKRERLIGIATISTVGVLLLVLGAIALFVLDLQLWTGRLTGEIRVRAYFASDFPREEAQKAADDIAEWPEVKSVLFVSKEEGWEEMKDKLASSARLGDDFQNILPDAVWVRPTDVDLVAKLSTKLEGLNGVKTVNPSSEESKRTGGLTQSIARAKRVVSWAGLVVAVLVVVAGVFIVHNTIRLALHSRWREIYIMQLVGATRTTVAAPFLLEGMLQGLIGSALACCLLVPAHMYLRDLSARAAPFFFLLPDSALFSFSLYLLLAGAVLGLSGSALSIRRYLRRRPEWQG
jgi:cell division transport system permease protein